MISSARAVALRVAYARPFARLPVPVASRPHVAIQAAAAPAPRWPMPGHMAAPAGTAAADSPGLTIHRRMASQAGQGSGGSRRSIIARARVKGRRKGMTSPETQSSLAPVPKDKELEAEALEELLDDIVEGDLSQEEFEGAAEGDAAAAAAAATDDPFMALGLEDLFTARLSEFSVMEPTEVQKAAVPAILSRKNTAIASYTGSGKTLAYMLPGLQLAVKEAERLLETVDPAERARLGPTVIIVAPSRELAMQILGVARQILPDEAKHAVQQLIGGANIRRQDEALKVHQPIMVVGTPGRLAEHSRRGTLPTHRTGVLILDEADQLMAPNFREDMLRLTQHCGKRLEGGRQTVLVSATLTPGVLKSATKWCPDPEVVFLRHGTPKAVVEAAGPEAKGLGPKGEESGGGPSWGWGSQAGGAFAKAGGSSAAGVANQDAPPSMPPGLKHFYISVPFRHKVDAVRKAIHAVGAERALVFMNFQNRIKDTEAKLSTRKMPVAGLHGDLNAMQRRNILQGFRAGKYRALIVSDVAARGLDVQDCDAVINLELPSEATHYAHRAGRTGRAGRDGTVVTVVSGSETHVVDKMANRLGISIQEGEVKYGQLKAAKLGEGEAVSQ